MFSARRNEDDGCQVVEAAVMRRALSTRSCAGHTHVGAVSLRNPTSHTTTRRAEAFPGAKAIEAALADSMQAFVHLFRERGDQARRRERPG